ncbi:SHOCT domain-containing protein, partial [Methylobacterium sp. WL103]
PPAPKPQPAAAPEPAPDGDVFTKIERLAELHGRGVLTEAEFADKKAELLSRI